MAGQLTPIICCRSFPTSLWTSRLSLTCSTATTRPTISSLMTQLTNFWRHSSSSHQPCRVAVNTCIRAGQEKKVSSFCTLSITMTSMIRTTTITQAEKSVQASPRDELISSSQVRKVSTIPLPTEAHMSNIRATKYNKGKASTRQLITWLQAHPMALTQKRSVVRSSLFTVSRRARSICAVPSLRTGLWGRAPRATNSSWLSVSASLAW